jgi:hypothetical protein
MELKTSISEEFLSLFYNGIDCDIEDTHSKLSLRILRIENNKFCYPELISKLSNAVISFSLSRQEFSVLEKDKRYGELNTKALEKFRNYKTNDGEAGELLLYCFLESHLKAPKILTKLEIKTSSNDYVKGSDGIHLLKIDETKYQLIFGESKLDASLTTSLSEAFKSINDFINRPKNNINSEIGLINSQLCKEAFDENLYNSIKSIIFPTANDNSIIIKDNAFAIFAGFDLKITAEEEKMINDEFRESVKKRIIADVESKKSHIKNKIDEYKLHGYCFYVYIFPFTKFDETRKKIIEDLVSSK